MDDDPISVDEAIERAESVLPGETMDESPSPRWQAVIGVGEFVESDPDAVWDFTRRWGSSPISDLREAIATCILEHLLEYHFNSIFPRVETLVRRDVNFAQTFQRCWKFGQSNHPGNSERFDVLQAWCLENVG